MSASRSLDRADWAVLRELQADARLSFNELARRVHLSGPSVAERVRRLERDGVITGYRAQVDPARTGQALTAFVRLRCRPGACLLRTTGADDFPEVGEIHKLSGEHCTMLKIRTSSLAHLEGLLERLGGYGDLRTDIVLSTQYEGRPIGPVETDRPTEHSAGWRTPTTAVSDDRQP